MIGRVVSCVSAVDCVWGEGVIRENDRFEQQKIVRYTHLVANAVILYNVHVLTTRVADLQPARHPIDPVC